MAKPVRKYPKNFETLVGAISDAMRVHRIELDARIDAIERRVVPLEQKVAKLRVRVPAPTRQV